jgi:hypothetical protein
LLLVRQRSFTFAAYQQRLLLVEAGHTNEGGQRLLLVEAEHTNKGANYNFMKQVIALILILCVSPKCKCRLATDPTSKPYTSIAISKENNAFIAEYSPQSPYLMLNQKKIYIKEAWLEHSHLERNFRDIFTVDSCIVINTDGGATDLRIYVKEMGNGSERIWFNLSWEGKRRDTIVLFYRNSLGVKEKNKEFLFFKKQ